jgi:hypothetical protein
MEAMVQLLVDRHAELFDEPKNIRHHWPRSYCRSRLRGIIGNAMLRDINAGKVT